MDSTLYKQLPFIIKRDDTTSIVVECNITQDSKVEFCTTMINYAGNAFFGEATSSSSTNVFLLNYSHFLVGKNIVKINTELNKKYTFILKGKGYTEMNGKVIHEDTFDWNFSKNHLVIAGAFRTGSFTSYHQYFYYCKIYEDGTNISYHLVPCKRLSDNIVGLYDLVNDKFYTPSRGIYKEPFNLNSVTSIQIPEGNVTKIEDKEGKILWANINKLAYGVRWNSVNQATTACERIGNLELHKTLPIQSRFKVCIHKGKEIQYYCNPDDSRFRENPTILSKDNFVFEYCNGLPSGIVSCDENSEVTYKIINDIFADYKYLYAYIYIRSGENTSLARIVYIDTINKTAYINAHGLSKSTYADITAPLNLIVATDADYTVELGTVLNGYDGEIGVDTGGKFYQWSVDNDGAGNEVWQSLYKCVPYAREIKRHIIGIDRVCVLNTAFNDAKWGWIGGLTAYTAVNVINYHTNLRGGGNDSTLDKYLGVDNFRCQFGKARTHFVLNAMRKDSQKTNGGQILYKQIWEAIVWSYVIEYADFDVKKTYNSELTTEGYHQGGLGNGVALGNDLTNYNNSMKLVPSDYTLEFGNTTNIKTRAARQWDITVAANHYWNYYNIDNININNKQTSDNKTLIIAAILNIESNNIYADRYKVGGTVKYKITGLTDGQTIVFKREKGNLTIITDGTYDVEWGTNDVIRTIDFGKTQTECNITIEIISAPAYTIIQNQVAWNVPHWRGFNVFWYGDIWIRIDNMLNKYYTDKLKRIWYYTDDVSKFDNNIDNKEHQIEALGIRDNHWLQEVRINNKGDIVPSKINSSRAYKNSYHWNCTNTNISGNSVGGRVGNDDKCGLFCSSACDSINSYGNDAGFVKVTILDD